MTGVEILATNEVATDYAFNWVAFWVCAGIVLTIYAVFFIVVSAISRDWSDWTWVSIIAAIASVFLAIVAGSARKTPESYITEYKCVISDEVSMTEFFERYEIIDQEGQIFTVREKATGGKDD